ALMRAPLVVLFDPPVEASSDSANIRRSRPRSNGSSSHSGSRRPSSPSRTMKLGTRVFSQSGNAPSTMAGPSAATTTERTPYKLPRHRRDHLWLRSQHRPREHAELEDHPSAQS